MENVLQWNINGLGSCSSLLDGMSEKVSCSHQFVCLICDFILFLSDITVDFTCLFKKF